MNPFHCLGIEEDLLISMEKVTQAYYVAQKATHPDSLASRQHPTTEGVGDDTESDRLQKTIEINDAFKQLQTATGRAICYAQSIFSDKTAEDILEREATLNPIRITHIFAYREKLQTFLELKKEKEKDLLLETILGEILSLLKNLPTKETFVDVQSDIIMLRYLEKILADHRKKTFLL